MSLKDLRALLERHGLHAKKSFGQNFLIDEHALEEIARAALRGAPKAIVEIGPGPGVLTELLAAAGIPLAAIEKDRGMLPLLTERFADRPHVRFVEGDALDIDFASLHPGIDRPAIAGNIPYQISSPLLIALIEQREKLGPITLMIQKEVADRWRADPGSRAYGSLTVLLSAFGRIEKIRDVPPGSFFPSPKVDSSVIRIVWHAQAPAIGDPRHFERVVRAAFSQRRKMLRNSLRTQFETSAVEAAAQTTGIDLQRRAETLTLQEFSSLAASLPSARASSPSDPS